MLLQLICAAVGKKDIAAVRIDDHETVAVLAKSFAEDLQYTGALAAFEMYLTKESTTEKGDATDKWLTTLDPHYGPLSRDDERIKALYLTPAKLLNPTLALQHYFDDKTPRSKVIHILVKFPDEVINLPGEQTSLLQGNTMAQRQIRKSCGLKFLFWTAVFFIVVTNMLNIALIVDGQGFSFEGKKLEQLRDFCAFNLFSAFGLYGLLYCEAARNSANE